MNEEITLKYLEVDKKMQGHNKEIKVTRRSLDTIIEMATDYSKVLSNLAEGVNDSAYKKAQLKYKAQEVEKIANDLTEKVGYCKDCKNAREIDDVGMDAFAIMANRNRNKGENK